MKLMTNALILASLLATVAPAQGGEGAEVNVEELVKQIRRNMIAVEREIDRVETEAAAENAKAAKENLEKLISSLKGRSDQIASDIDEMIKNLKQQQGQSSSSSSSKSQKQQSQSQARDRNKRENRGNKPQDSQGQPRDGSKENNTAADKPGGRNKSGSKKPEPNKVRVPVNWDAERWGHLPPELRQRLIDRNFKAFTPPYAEELKEYYKKIGGGR